MIYTILALALLFFIYLTRGSYKDSPPIEHKIATIDEIHSRVDCDVSQIPCFKSSDCLRICRDGDSLVDCDNVDMVCTVTSNDEPLPDPPDEKCNEAHGILMVLVPDLVTGETSFKCRSVVAPYIFSDEDELNKGYCANGTFEVDLMHGYISPENCKCPKNYLLFIGENEIPACLNVSGLRLVPDLILDERVLRKNESYVKQLVDDYNKSLDLDFEDNSWTDRRGI